MEVPREFVTLGGNNGFLLSDRLKNHKVGVNQENGSHGAVYTAAGARRLHAGHTLSKWSTQTISELGCVTQVL